ncbi:hypothetical protein ACVWYH_005981 [Bradyrhizobium sp. GM24.11]
MDATVVTLEAGYVTADMPFKQRLPRNELKTESVVDHGKTTTDKIGDSGQTASYTDNTARF